MRRGISILALIFLSSAAPDAQVWKSHTAGNDIRNISRQGGFTWCATNAGVVRWNTRDSTSTRFTVLEGLDNPSTNLISADRNGGAWVTYTNVLGASYWNGSIWRRYDETNSGIPGSTVKSLFTDSKGNTWFGFSSEGIARFDGSSWRRFLPDAALNATPVDIAVDRNGTKWVATIAGAVSFDDAGYRVFSTADGLAGNSVRRIKVDAAGYLWFCTNNGVSRFDGTSWKTWRTTDGLAGSNVRDLSFAPDGAVWFATDDGVSRFDGVSWKTYTVNNGLIQSNASGIEVDKSGRVWVCHPTEGLGVSCFDNDVWKWVSTWNSGIAGNYVTDIETGPDGGIWFVTVTGLSSLYGVKWKTWTTRDGLPSDKVYGIRVDGRNRVWVYYPPFYYLGASVIDGGAVTTYTTHDGLVNNAVTSISFDGNAVWFCTERGLSRFDGVSWTKWGSNERLVSPMINDITESPDSAIWFATGGGLSRFDGVSWRTFTVEDGLPSNTVIAAAAGPDGRVWVVSDSTLVEFDGRAFIPHPMEQNEQNRFVRLLLRSLTVDSRNRVWTNLIPLGEITPSSANRGMYCYDGSGWTILPVISEEGTVFHGKVVADENETLWTGSPGGLVRYAGSQTTWKLDGPDARASGLVKVDDKNVKWFYSNVLWSFDDRIWKQSALGDFFLSPTLFALDGNGVKWMYNILKHDIISLDGETVREYAKPDGIDLSGLSFTKFYVDHTDTKWFVTQVEGVIRFDGSSWKWFMNTGSLPSDTIRAIAADAENTVWFVTMKGVYSFDGVTWKIYTPKDGLSSYALTSVAVDSKNGKWFGALDGLTRFDGVSWKTYRKADGLADDAIWNVAAGTDGVWAGATNGIARFDGTSWKSFITREPLLSSSAFFVDGKNRLWTSGQNTLISCDGQSVRYHPLRQASSITEDRNGVMWFVTQDGIFSLDERPKPSPGDRPRALSLLGNYPNPFNRETAIAFDLLSWGRVDLEIYNVMGQKVRTLRPGPLDAGRRALLWDGADGRGRKVSSGVYLYRVLKDGVPATGKMMLLR